MLTPGMNDHGLGPGIDEFTFGHGGADEGFRADLTAWKDTPNALVIIVNSDNGSIIDEVKLAIAKEYKLTGIEPNIKKVAQMPVEKLNRYTGKYLIDELGELEIMNLSNQLFVVGKFLNYTLQIRAESDSVFFTTDDSTTLTFSIEDDSVKGFKFQQFTAKRVE